MKVEALAKGNIEDVMIKNNIPFTMKYIGKIYKVVELDKQDTKRIKNDEIDMEGAWCFISTGSGGTACDIVRINGLQLIVWGFNGCKDSYDNLTDYLHDLDVDNDEDICHFAMGLAKANGISMSRLFNACEGE